MKKETKEEMKIKAYDLFIEREMINHRLVEIAKQLTILSTEIAKPEKKKG